MRLYVVSVTFIIRSLNGSTADSLEVFRYANSAASAMAAVGSLLGAISNFAFSTGTNEGKKQLEITQISATELTENSTSEITENSTSEIPE